MIDLSKPICTRRGRPVQVLAVLPPAHHIDGDTIVALIDADVDEDRALLTFTGDGMFRSDGKPSGYDLVNVS